MAAVTYSLLKKTNPLYDGWRWHVIRSLAKGSGPVDDMKVLCHLLPRREGEPESVYKMRLDAVYHTPYMGRLLGQIVSSLGSDPLGVTAKESEDDTVISPDLEWYREFTRDVSAPDGQTQTLDEFMCQQARIALLTGRAWTLVDLPSMPDEALEPRNLAEEMASGALDAYLCAVDPEDVIEWEWDEDSDTLLWAICHSVKRPRRSFLDSRSTVEERFCLYTQGEWVRFLYRYDKENPPKEDDAPTSTTTGRHSFGCVPLVPFELPEELQLGPALQSTAVELFRKQNGLSWSEDRGLYAQLVERTSHDPKAMMAKEMGDVPPVEAQTAGPGSILRSQPGSTLEYLSPPKHVYVIAQEKCVYLRDELYRITNQLALASNASGAAIGRSAESKGLDMQALSIMLAEIGKNVRQHVDRVLQVIAAGRGDPGDVKSTGQAEFELVDRAQLLDEAMKVIGGDPAKRIDVPSTTFKSIYAADITRQLLPRATQEEMASIRKELNQVAPEAVTEVPSQTAKIV